MTVVACLKVRFDCKKPPKSGILSKMSIRSASGELPTPLTGHKGLAAIGAGLDGGLDKENQENSR